MILNEAQVKEFKDKGYIVLPGFFEQAVMEKVSGYIDALQDKQPGKNEEAKYYETSTITGDNVLVRIENVFGDHNPELTELLILPKTIGCLTDLLGDVPVLFKEKVNYKLPGCRPDKLHQDQAAGWNRYCDFFVSMCIVVDENREENAALSFMSSGNYKRGLMTEEWTPLTEDDPPYSPADEYSMIEANPGDVIFFDCYVPHGSPGNTSNQSRRNIYLTFNRESDGDFRKAYYADKWAAYPPNQLDTARAGKSFRV